MANRHLNNTTALRWNYIGQCGVTPTPMAPWCERRKALAAKIAARTEGLAVNIRWTAKTNTSETESRDLRRLIDEGYAQMSHKNGGPRAQKETEKWRFRGGGKHHKVVRLTEKGMALLPPPAPEPTLGPYAKRRAALAH